ncbi:hypothetical protein [Streptomyces sp. DSM 41534]
MTDITPDLEALYAAPSADNGPTSPREELLAAARTLQQRDDWLSSELMTWLVDTATLHGPDDDGRHCHRDSDTWPCFDVQAAQKVAFAIGFTRPTS